MLRLPSRSMRCSTPTWSIGGQRERSGDDAGTVAIGSPIAGHHTTGGEDDEAALQHWAGRNRARSVYYPRITRPVRPSSRNELVWNSVTIEGMSGTINASNSALLRFPVEI